MFTEFIYVSCKYIDIITGKREFDICWDIKINPKRWCIYYGKHLPLYKIYNRNCTCEKFVVDWITYLKYSNILNLVEKDKV